jgi:regulatory protein
MASPSLNRRSRSGRTEREPLDERQLYDYAVGLLSRSMRTVAQLRRLMRGRARPGPEGEANIDAALARLRDHGYVSDQRFAQAYTSSRKDTQRLGRRRIAQELLQKGVPADVVSTELAAAFENVDEDAQALAFLARKRVPPPSNDQKAVARIFRMLLRAGFPASAASRALKKLRAQAGESTALLDDLGALEDGMDEGS